MTTFNVPDMTCGHCEATVTNAIQGIDQSAIVKADLVTNKIEVTSTAKTEAILGVLNEAGYPSSVAV